MKKMLLISLLLSVTLNFSCKKKEDVIIDPIPAIKLNILWQSTFADETIEYISIDPIINGNTLISSYYPINDSIVDETLIALNKEDGAEMWSWDEYIRPSPQKIRGRSRTHTFENILSACSSQDNYAININSGQTLWASNIEDGNPRTSLFSNLLFHTITYGTAPFGDSSKIIVSDIHFGVWNEVFKISKSDDLEAHLEPPSVFINNNSDTLIIFQNRQINLVNYDEKIDLYCFNMTQDSLFWKIENVTSSGSSNVSSGIVENNYFYFGGKWDFLCIDITSGEIIWNHNFYWDYQGSNYLIYNDLIITNLDNGDLIAIDKNSGNQVWVNEGLSYCCTELRVYNDRIYFGNDKLFIVDANSGELLYKFASPNPGGSFINAIAVDLAAQKMYTSDGKAILCMELPE